MKALRTLIRLHKQHLDEQRVRLVEFEIEQEALRARAAGLAAEVEAEGRMAATSFEAGRSFPSYVERVGAERRALAAQIAELDAAIAEADEAVAAAYQDLEKYKITHGLRERRARVSEDRREQAQLDEAGITIYRRKRAG